MVEFLDDYTKDKKTTHILNQYIHGFIYNLKESEDIKQKTLYLHIKYVELFDKYLFYSMQDSKLKDINEKVIKDYIIFCSDGLNNNNKTVNKKLNTLTKFFGYLTHNKYLFRYNFMLNIPLLKNEKEKKPTLFTTSELLLLFNQMRKYIYGYRDIVISKIILETGMLTKDILDLKIDQVSIENKTLLIMELNKSHIYNLSGNLTMDLKQYLILRETFNKKGSPYLFLSLRGNQYSIRSYQLFFEEAIVRCNLKSTYSPRHLRSTFLFNMSKLVSEERLKIIADQESVKQYYELNSNPLRNLV